MRPRMQTSSGRMSAWRISDSPHKSLRAQFQSELQACKAVVFKQHLQRKRFVFADESMTLNNIQACCSMRHAGSRITIIQPINCLLLWKQASRASLAWRKVTLRVTPQSRMPLVLLALLAFGSLLGVAALHDGSNGPWGQLRRRVSARHAR